MLVHICNQNTWEVEAGGSEVQGHPWLHSEFEASLGYVRLCFKQTDFSVWRVLVGTREADEGYWGACSGLHSETLSQKTKE